MKIAKYSHARLLCLLICTAWTDAISNAKTEAPIRTDKQEYSITRAPDSTIRVTIKTVYTNRSQSTVYLPGCPWPSPPVVEKKVGDGWVPLYSPIEFLCAKDPLPVEPGEKYTDTLNIAVAPLGSRIHPQLNPEIKEVAGTYRLVRRILRDYRADSLLPLEERVSNEFKLKE
jgi:hypothetical protein